MNRPKIQEKILLKKSRLKSNDNMLSVEEGVEDTGSIIWNYFKVDDAQLLLFLAFLALYEQHEHSINHYFAACRCVLQRVPGAARVCRALAQRARQRAGTRCSTLAARGVGTHASPVLRSGQVTGLGK